MGSPGFPKLRGIDTQASRTQDNIAQQLQPIALALAQTPIMGAPAPAWIAPSLLGGFANFGGAFAVAGYHRDALGYVHTKGTFLVTAGAAAGTQIMLFPSGYRPRELARLSVVGDAGTAQFIEVAPTGIVTVGVAVPAPGSCDFFFSFLAEQ